jgi:hypothetical protein
MRLPTLSLTIATFVALSLACAAPKDDEEEEEEDLFGDADTDVDADTDADTDADGPFELGGDDGGLTTDGVSGDCAGDTCIYRITTTAPAGELGVKIVETGPDTSSPWSEEHDGFSRESVNDDGSETYRLDLEWVVDYTDQVDGQSTLLNPDVVNMSGLTWLFFAVSEDDSDADCLVIGDDPSYYASDCTEVGR